MRRFPLVSRPASGLKTAKSGYFMPWKAWRVDAAEGKLIPVDNDLVACARFSIDDDRGHPKSK